MVDIDYKIVYFQAITGVEDLDLCTEILQAHGWDLELAVSTFFGSNLPDNFASTSSAPPDAATNSEPDDYFSQQVGEGPPGAGPSLTWKLITLPISVISGSLGLVSGAIGLGMWIADGVLSYSLGMIGEDLNSILSADSSGRLVNVSSAASEAIHFVASFKREYGFIPTRPNFVSEGFVDAFRRSRNSYKLLFVYLHSPEHPDTPLFCERTLCNEAVAAFVNENFVAWGGSIRASEGFKMSRRFKASGFPFCAVVAFIATNQVYAVLQQIEGPKTPEETLTLLRRVFVESFPSLIAARSDDERNNMRSREEQVAVYRATLKADQARERQIREEQERLERKAAKAERKRKEEEEAPERAEREAEEKAAAIAKLREEKALSLGAEPGPNVTQVCNLEIPRRRRNPNAI